MARDGIGREGGRGTSYQSGDGRGQAIAQFTFLMQYRRDILEASRDVLGPLYPDDAAALDVDLQQANAAIHAAALELAASRPPVDEDDLAPVAPDRGAFVRALVPIIGAQRIYALDREYPGFDRALREGAWDIALAGLDAMLADEVLTQAEYDAIQEAWDDARLGRPAEW